MERLEPAAKSATSSGPDRREFVKLALGTTLGGAALTSVAPRTASGGVHQSDPGIKLCAQIGSKPTDEDLLFLKQMGAEYVSVASTPDMRTAEGFLAIKKRFADAGITVWNIGNIDVHNMPEVTLNLARPRCQDRGVQAVPAQSWTGGDLLHDVCAHGQRHMEQRPGRDPWIVRQGV